MEYFGEKSNKKHNTTQLLNFRNKSKPPAANNYKLLEKTPGRDKTSDHSTLNDNVTQTAHYELDSVRYTRKLSQVSSQPFTVRCKSIQD